jgi:hypothetical protein
MSEIADFVNHGAAFVTPALVDRILREVPLWKVEFTQINEPRYPHLVDQLEFLADIVEDVAEGVYKELPYIAFARAVFALMYVHKKVNIIPDNVPDFGRAMIRVSCARCSFRTNSPLRNMPDRKVLIGRASRVIRERAERGHSVRE